MIDLFLTPAPTDAPPVKRACEGSCKGCGKAHIKVMAPRSMDELHFYDRLMAAFEQMPMPHKIITVTDPQAIAAAGVRQTPALVMDGRIMAEGRVPSTNEIAELIEERYLMPSKLYRLQKIGVAIDLSTSNTHALEYAWAIAQKNNALLEVVYVIDGMFDGHLPDSSNGFLSDYQRSIKAELDVFVCDSLAPLGVVYKPLTDELPENPFEAPTKPIIRTKVLYGFPDFALSQYSEGLDLLVMGSTNKTGLNLKLFGSVAVEVSSLARCPVLLVPPTAVFKDFEQILYASNFESVNTITVRQAMHFARFFDAQLHFVHVGPATEKDYRPERRLFEMAYHSAHENKPFLFTRILNDAVAPSLYEYARRHNVDLLVFVTHQRSFWESIMHHSITREVAASSQWPILVIHSDDLK
jgi:nucleotide-binding universal stress UspA family protein